MTLENYWVCIALLIRLAWENDLKTFRLGWFLRHFHLNYSINNASDALPLLSA